MRTSGRIATFLVAAGIGAIVACGDSAPPVGSGDNVINDTMGQDVYAPPPPPSYDGGDAPYDAADGYAPALMTCGGCSCDPTKNYCFSGGVARAIQGVPAGGFFGMDAGGEAGPPPPACKLLEAGAVTNGCIPLPAACTASPTCGCLLKALQPLYKCYLVCTPSPGFLEVYCPGP